MKLRKIISVLLVAVLTLSLAVSCGEEKQLATPENLAVSAEGLVTWSAVDNATGYVVKVNDDEYTVTETQYRLADAITSATISVSATAKGYKNSAAAETTYNATSEHTVAIKAPDNVKGYEGNVVLLKAYVDGEATDNVEWKVTSGDEYVSVDADGKLTVLKDVTGDKIVKIFAFAKIDRRAYAETELIVAAKPALTQSMLDAVAKQKVAFEGFLRLDVYNIRLGAKGKFNSTHMSQIRTAMNGTDWFSEYLNSSAGVNQRIFCRNVNGTATQVGVNLMNEEQNYTMKDANDNPLSWEDSGLYNSFIGLKVSDFRFNETNWRYEYVSKGENDSTVQRMCAAANPYEVEAKTMELIIDDGEVMGIYALAEDDYNIAPNYITEPRLYAVIDAGENVSVPTIGKYKAYDEYAVDSDEYKVLKKLHDAVADARAAERYNVRITHVQQSSLTNTLSVSEGYEETVTPDKCYFREYNILRQGTATEEHVYRDDRYGYRKINDNLYNSYYNVKSSSEGKAAAGDEVTFTASRAFNADFKEAKPSFGFSEAIFTSYAISDDGSITYYVDENMYSVATTFYKGLGNDIALYGIFATKGYVNNVEFKPFVTVDTDGKIAGAGFFYSMSYMYGVMLVEYTDFNDAENAVIDPAIEAAIDATAVRQLPTSWEQLTISETVENVEHAYKVTDYLPTYFTKAGTPMSEGAVLPFFGSADCLGDTYGFGMPTYYTPSGQTAKRAILFYYDVQLDIDASIQSSLDKVDTFLKGLGYTSNVHGEYRCEDNNLVIVPTDNSLDLIIYLYVDKQ